LFRLQEIKPCLLLHPLLGRSSLVGFGTKELMLMRIEYLDMIKSLAEKKCLKFRKKSFGRMEKVITFAAPKREKKSSLTF
jgi:hypothetical protein